MGAVLNLQRINEIIEADSNYPDFLNKVYVDSSGNYTINSNNVGNPPHLNNYKCFNYSNISSSYKTLLNYITKVRYPFYSGMNMNGYKMTFPGTSGTNAKRLLTDENFLAQTIHPVGWEYRRAGSVYSMPMYIDFFTPYYQPIHGYISEIASWLPYDFICGTYGDNKSYVINGTTLTLPSGIFTFPPAYLNAKLHLNAPNLGSWGAFAPLSSKYQDVWNNYEYLTIIVNYYNSWIGNNLGGANSSSIPDSTYPSFGWDILNPSSQSTITSRINTGINQYKSYCSSHSSGSSSKATVQVQYLYLNNFTNSTSYQSTSADGLLTKSSTETYWMIPDQPYTSSYSNSTPTQNGQLDYDWGLYSVFDENNEWTYKGNEPQNVLISYIFSGLQSGGVSADIRENVCVIHEVFLYNADDLSNNQKKELFGGSVAYEASGYFPIIVKSYIILGMRLTYDYVHFSHPNVSDGYYPWGVMWQTGSSGASKYTYVGSLPGDPNHNSSLQLSCKNQNIRIYGTTENLDDTPYMSPSAYSASYNLFSPN